MKTANHFDYKITPHQQYAITSKTQSIQTETKEQTMNE